MKALPLEIKPTYFIALLVLSKPWNNACNREVFCFMDVNRSTEVTEEAAG
jgi:hypothetical protein